MSARCRCLFTAINPDNLFYIHRPFFLRYIFLFTSPPDFNLITFKCPSGGGLGQCVVSLNPGSFGLYVEVLLGKLLYPALSLIYHWHVSVIDKVLCECVCMCVGDCLVVL